eukprot:657688-Pelagomonas_calceolata.AAC.8
MRDFREAIGQLALCEEQCMFGSTTATVVHACMQISTCVCIGVGGWQLCLPFQEPGQGVLSPQVALWCLHVCCKQ